MRKYQNKLRITIFMTIFLTRTNWRKGFILKTIFTISKMKPIKYQKYQAFSAEMTISMILHLKLRKNKKIKTLGLIQSLHPFTCSEKGLKRFRKIKIWKKYKLTLMKRKWHLLGIKIIKGNTSKKSQALRIKDSMTNYWMNSLKLSPVSMKNREDRN